MKFRNLYVFLIVFVLALASSESAYSQLLEDRNKLKTEKRQRKGFKPFKKNVKKPAKTNQKPQVAKTPPVRNTKDKAGDQGKFDIRPRYTSDRAGKGQDRKVAPRYGTEKAGDQGKFKIFPRFTQEHAGNQGKFITAPRFTQEHAGSQGKFKIAPRYTQEHAGSQGKRKIAPRYTQEHAGDQGKFVIAPRYTQEHAGDQGKFNIRPRYTQDWAGKGSDRKVRPRYSIPPGYVSNPASGRKRGFLPVIQFGQMKPRYKKDKSSEFFGPSVALVYRPSNSAAKYNKSVSSYQRYKNKSGRKSPYYLQTSYFGPKVKSTYVPSNSMAKHNKSLDDYQKYIAKEPKNAPYNPQAHFTWTAKKRRKAKNSHPSANYLTAKYDDSRMMRNTKRNVSVTWVRVFGNKTQPKGVKKKVDKAKFDKDEKDIWNNKEREYTRN